LITANKKHTWISGGVQIFEEQVLILSLQHSLTTCCRFISWRLLT